MATQSPGKKTKRPDHRPTHARYNATGRWFTNKLRRLTHLAKRHKKLGNDRAVEVFEGHIERIKTARALA